MPQSCLAKAKICQINYGRRDLEKESTLNLIKKLTQKSSIECVQIGVEHNKFKEPLPHKPIFACCQDFMEDERTLQDSEEVI